MTGYYTTVQEESSGPSEPLNTKWSLVARVVGKQRYTAQGVAQPYITYKYNGNACGWPGLSHAFSFPPLSPVVTRLQAQAARDCQLSHHSLVADRNRAVMIR